jgi:16S rRNA (guanine1207-N2)-methyltransferase
VGGEQYFAAEPVVPSSPRSVPLDLPGLSLTLRADAGVFSANRVDPGTRVLLEELPEPRVAGDLLDLGCGYGPIALTLAARNPGRTVWAVDVNTRAVELTRANAAAAGLDRVRAVLPDEVPAGTRFAGIWSHPPIRIGKDALHTLLTGWLDRLLSGGAAWLVVQRNLGADSLARWLTEHGYPATRLRSRLGYRVLEVRCPS